MHMDSKLKQLNDNLPAFLMTDGYFLIGVTFKWQVEGWLAILKVAAQTGTERYIGFYGANTINGCVQKMIDDRPSGWSKLKIDDWHRKNLTESKN